MADANTIVNHYSVETYILVSWEALFTKDLTLATLPNQLALAGYVASALSFHLYGIIQRWCRIHVRYL